MAVSLWGTAGYIALMATLHFVIVVLPSGLCQRHLKSSESFVNRPYNTESLSDALSATYKVLIESDGLLSSYSYQNSLHYQSVAIATPNPHHKTLLPYITVLFMAGQAMGLLGLVTSDAEDVNSFRMGFFSHNMFGSFKEDDAGCATVYFNATETNLVTSSDFAVFASSERTEIPIKWSAETLFLVVLGLFAWSAMLSNIATHKGGIGGRKKSMCDLFLIFGVCIAILCCSHIAILVQIVKTRRRTVPSIEVQLAQAA
ncbi:hypothetical protein POJ06DRAFT_263358, partial [Lipomyces tetrasporus]